MWRVRLSLLPTERGGRHGPVAPGYIPNIAFDEVGDVLYDMRIISGMVISPGSDGVVDITVFSPDAAARLAPGARFRLQEGPFVIGHGQVLYRLTE
jgi:translation elongation factor EF-Tu-like GTPase